MAILSCWSLSADQAKRAKFLLHLMCFAQAEKAAEAASSWEGRTDYEGGGTPEDAAEGSGPQGPPGEGAAKALVDALAMAMYGLAHTGAQRVARLCEVPSNLACWALELLEEQACTVRMSSDPPHWTLRYPRCWFFEYLETMQGPLH